MAQESKTILELEKLANTFPDEGDQFPIARESSLGDNKWALGDIISFDSTNNTITLYGQYVIDVKDIYLVEKTITISEEKSGSVVLKINDVVGTKASTGDTVSLVATPESGYQFDKWIDLDTSEVLSEATSYEFTFNASSPTNIQAVFEQIPNRTLTININESTMGSVTVNDIAYTNPVDVEYGSRPTLVVNPNQGYIFVGWYVNNVRKSTGTTYILPEVTADTTVEARLVENIPDYYIGFAPNMTASEFNAYTGDLTAMATEYFKALTNTMTKDVDGKGVFFIMWRDGKTFTNAVFHGGLETKTYTYAQISTHTTPFNVQHADVTTSDNVLYHVAGRYSLSYGDSEFYEMNF